MRVTILGNNSALPAFRRHPTAQAVTVHGDVLLIDCGEATQIQMQRHGVRWRKLHHIFISHMHGDHYFGLPGLINSMSLGGRTEPLYLYAPAELQPIIEAILAAAATVLTYPLHFVPLPPGDAILVDTPYFSVQCFPVMHRIQCHGFVVQGKAKSRKLLPDKCEEYGIPHTSYESLTRGSDYVKEDGTIVKNDWVTATGQPPKKYAYCADTIYTETILPYIQHADAIYHESTYLAEDADKAVARFHSTSVQAAQIAKLGNVRQLLLGHFSSKYRELEPFMVEASAIFPNTIVTQEGIAYDL